MKKTALILALLFLSLSISSCNKISSEMTVVKNCTGVYLKNNNNSYRVCNYNLLDDYQDGDKINITVKKTESCIEESPFNICYLNYPSKGVVEILNIK